MIQKRKNNSQSNPNSNEGKTPLIFRAIKIKFKKQWSLKIKKPPLIY